MKPLLLLIDLQQDYLSAPGLVPSAGSVVSHASRLLEECRQRQIPVAHIWTTVSRTKDERMPHWKAQERWICEEGTQGHHPPECLTPLPGEAIVHKTGFSPFVRPELESLIAAGGHDCIIVAGVHLHACVRETILGAYERGLSVWVVDETCGSDAPLHAAITRRYLSSRAARFVSIPQLLHEFTLPSPGTPTPGTLADRDLPVPMSPGPGVSEVPPLERIQLLRDLAERLEAEAVPLAARMADVIGKPIYYGQAEIRRTAAMIRTVIARSQADLRSNHGDPEGVRHCPIGGVAVITPWNNPYYIPLGKIVPALLYGNTVAWKPAPQTWPIAAELQTWMRHKLPAIDSILTFVEGGRDVADRLMNHPAIQAVTLTGSLESGYTAQEICARRHLPYQAELGGNNAAIVWGDADLHAAAEMIAEAAFGLAGQRCTANRRVIVQASRRPEFMSHLERVTAAMPWGDPLNEGTRIGPLATAAQRDRVAAVVRRASDTCPRSWTPASFREPLASWGHAGAWHPPTIIECHDASHEIVQQETFGPVLVVQTAENWNDALDLLNGVPQGLVAALFSHSEVLANDFLQKARAGILKINQATADAGLDLPFGGWKNSGSGPPEHGRFDREFFTRAQTNYIQTDNSLP